MDLFWRYVIDESEFPNNGEECLICDIYGHKMVAEFHNKLTIYRPKDLVTPFGIQTIDTYENHKNVFTSIINGEILPNRVKKWCPLSDVLSVIRDSNNDVNEND